MPDLQGWLFVIKTLDRPGAIVSVTSVFSGRGLQIDGFAAFGNNLCAEGNSSGHLVIHFQSSKSRKNMMFKLVNRLETVNCVAEYSFDEAPKKVKNALGDLKESLN